MAAFSVELLDLIRTRKVGVKPLVEFQFVSGTMRAHAGFGEFVAGGQSWFGVGKLVSMSNLEQSTQGDAPQVTFTLSGVSPDLFATAYSENGDDYVRQPVTVYVQFFNAETNALVENPKALWTGLMDSMKISRTNTEDGPLRTVTLTAETLFQDRARAAYGYYTDADQKARYPGDKGLERIAGLVRKTLLWPES